MTKFYTFHELKEMEKTSNAFHKLFEVAQKAAADWRFDMNVKILESKEDENFKESWQSLINFEKELASF